MAHHSAPDDDGLARLQMRMKANVAMEEAFVAALSDLLHDHRQLMDEGEIRTVAHLIRRHRVGLIKHRALLGALDLDA